MKGLKAAIAIASFLFYTILISTNVTVAADNPIHDEEQKQQIEIEEEIPEEEEPILESFEEIEQSSEVEIEDQDINRPKELVETDKDISKEVDNKIEAPSSREEVDTNVIVNANSINLKVGDSGKEVYDLKLKLAQLGFPVSANPNEDYGLKTAATVKEFQIYYGLKATGEADAATMAKIDEILSSPYRLGKSSSAVKQLKLNLAKIGFVVSDQPNNDYGPKTEAVVKEFQRLNGLKVNGIADEVTLAKINEWLNGELKMGMSGPRVLKLKQDLANLGFVVSNNPNEDYGPKTSAVVKEFQLYYGLKTTGEADGATLAKIEEVLSSTYRIGLSSPQVKTLKLNLATLGFQVSDNPNNDYGPKTATVVKEFQRYYGLRATGIADEVTLKKIDDMLSSPYRVGQSSPQVKTLKLNLATLGFPVSDNPNNDYGLKTSAVVKEFQKYYGLRATGIADEVTLKKIDDMLSSPYRVGQSSPQVKMLKLDLAKLGFIVSSNPNNDYGPQTERVVREFQKHYGLRVNGIADEVTLEKIATELKNKVRTVFIDPGHGGSDPGAVAGGYKEKDINLSVAKKVQSILKQRGYDVIMSRSDDTTVGLYDRPQMANNLSNVDIFVSIHSNANGNSSVNGIESYYYKYKPEYPPTINENMHNNPQRIERSVTLTQLIHNKMLSYTNANNRGTNGASFVVVRETRIPATLLELGYITNASERSKLVTASYQEKLAKAIADGIEEYFQFYD